MSKSCAFVWSTWPRDEFLQFGSQASKLKLLKLADFQQEFKYSIGTCGDLEGNCKLFMVCSTTMTLIFETNFIISVTPSYPKLWWFKATILVSILVNNSSFTPPLVDSSMFVSPIRNGPHPPKHGPYLKLTFVYQTNVFGYPKHKNGGFLFFKHHQGHLKHDVSLVKHVPSHLRHPHLAYLHHVPPCPQILGFVLYCILMGCQRHVVWVELVLNFASVASNLFQFFLRHGCPILCLWNQMVFVVLAMLVEFLVLIELETNMHVLIIPPCLKQTLFCGGHWL